MFQKKQDVAIRTDSAMKGKELKEFKCQFREVMGLSEDEALAVLPAKVMPSLSVSRSSFALVIMSAWRFAGSSTSATSCFKVLRDCG